MTRIELSNLHKHFPRQPAPALRDVSLTIEPGELVALLGPSGSGKSTILRLIAGIEQPDTGTIHFDGKAIMRIPANRRGALLMFQKAYLFPFMTVADNIAFGLKIKGLQRHVIQSEVTRMLELVELPGIERKYPNQLSGGEQQRIALARALVTQPRVLMLDEPLSSLDTAVRLTLQEAIRRIQRELGITTLLVTHDLSEAIAMSDRTALLLHGRIAACDAPRQLFQRPPTRETARFVGVSTFLEGYVDHTCFQSNVGVLNVEPVTGSARNTTFAIRPEHLRLLDAPAGNALPGIVADLLYKGEFTEYQVTMNGSIVRVRDFLDNRRFGSGETVHVQFPPEHLFEVQT